MTVKTETAAETYARLKEQQFETALEQSFSNDALKGVQLYEHKVPSGMVFKVRDIDMSFVGIAGSMPMALSEQMLMAQASDAPAAPDVSKMSAMQLRANIQTNARIVRYMCVEPRIIIGEVNGHKNAISADLLTTADFGSLIARAQGGGNELNRLKTFRRKR